ncbi:unnamed protein product [Prunus brigantina]
MNFINFQKYPNLFSRSLFLLPSHHVASSHNLFTEPTPLLLFHSAYSFFLLDQLKRIAEPQDSGKRHILCLFLFNFNRPSFSLISRV